MKLLQRTSHDPLLFYRTFLFSETCWQGGWANTAEMIPLLTHPTTAAVTGSTIGHVEVNIDLRLISVHIFEKSASSIGYRHKKDAWLLNENVYFSS